LALLTGLKPAVMLDYYRSVSPAASLAPVAQLLRDCAAALGDGCAAAAEARCCVLGDCVFVLRPSLLRARATSTPLFVRLDAQQARRRSRTPETASFSSR
jgi:hypothetical protein